MDGKHLHNKLDALAQDFMLKSGEKYAVPSAKPHDWVARAMTQAYVMGQQEGLDAAQKKHDFVQTQADEQYREARTSEIRAMTAALLEAVGQGDLVREFAKLSAGGLRDPMMIKTTISLDKMRSVWSRWDYATNRVNDDIITITITKKD